MPAIFEPTSDLAYGEIWAALSGGDEWGGADIYVSVNGGTSYTRVGRVTSNAKQGLLTAILPSHADPDTVDTLSVDLTQSHGILQPVTHADADGFRTLSCIQPQPIANVVQPWELVAYGNVSTTGTYSADLTYLRRGLYGSTIGSHAIGEQFTLIDITGTTGSVVRFSLPIQYIGQTLLVKFSSFNLYNLQSQDLSGLAAYQYVPTGRGYGLGSGGVPLTPTGLSVGAGEGQNLITWNENDPRDNVTSYKLYAASGLSQPFSSAVLIWQGLATSYVQTGLASNSQFTYFLIAENVVGDSGHTSGVNGTSGTIVLGGRLVAATPGRKPLNAEVLFSVDMKGGDKLAATAPGSLLSSDTNATANWTITLTQNGTTVGTGTIPLGSNVGTYTVASDVNFSDGDVFQGTCQSPQDATLSGVRCTFLFTRTQ